VLLLVYAKGSPFIIRLQIKANKYRKKNYIQMALENMDRKI